MFTELEPKIKFEVVNKQTFTRYLKQKCSSISESLIRSRYLPDLRRTTHIGFSHGLLKRQSHSIQVHSVTPDKPLSIKYVNFSYPLIIKIGTHRHVHKAQPILT